MGRFKAVGSDRDSLASGQTGHTEASEYTPETLESWASRYSMEDPHEPLRALVESGAWWSEAQTQCWFCSGGLRVPNLVGVWPDSRPTYISLNHAILNDFLCASNRQGHV
jgi:hypothetical protein